MTLQQTGRYVTIRVRPEVAQFVELMELKLSMHDEERGDSWKKEPQDFFMARIEDEYAELLDAFIFGKMKNIQYEAADMANFLMMLSWKVQDDWAEKMAEIAPPWVGGCSR